MSGKVIDFTAARAAKQPEKVKKPSKSSVKKIITNQDVFMDVFDRIIEDWQRNAVKNKLNEFIRDKIPAHAQGADGADYVNDLNVISNVEKKLDMKVSVFYPEVLPVNPHGWLVGFQRGKETFSAPPDMASEGYARALNILLFLGLEVQLKKLKRS